MSLLASLGDSPLQPWPGACLGGQDAPTHQCPSSSSHPTAKHPNKPMQLSSTQEHPGLQKLPGLDTGRVANAVPKLPLSACLHSAPAHATMWHTTPTLARTSPPWGSHKWHHGCVLPQRARTSGCLGTGCVIFALPRHCMALQCLAGTSGAREAAEPGAQPRPRRDVRLCHPAWVLSL